ncbi:MAG: UDP-N-acetylmuramate--L-alanine ligase [Candidatus Harrisonbacteria bacterium]|nr:UDP-N-acetylmuramate--L-alanine ligase [Candidatus Harrisonbacteria bacterium]
MDKPPIYFIGIGGIGMSALARWFRANGYRVAGSDLQKTATTDELAREGIKIFVGPHHARRVTKTVRRVIYNQAIRPDNPELLRARALGIPASTYPDAVGDLTKIYKTVAIAGAHGKSTTTAMTALILERAKLDPTVIVGTKLKEFGNRNFRKGGGDYLIVEADEWKGSFLRYFPYAALITNIDREHLDFYKNFTAVKKAFVKFLDNVHPYGLVVLNRDDKNLFALRKRIKRPLVWYTVKSKEADAIKKIIKIPGEHNLSNATGAYTLCRALGVKKSVILSAISRYTGAWRRNEFRGHFRGADVYDDYGHHPTEIKATLAGFREKFAGRKIICVFQPHQRERLKILFKDFVGAFDAADELVLLEIYNVAGREEKHTRTTSQKLATAVAARRNATMPRGEALRGVPVCATMKELKNALRAVIATPTQGALIVMMGAGNINEWTDKIISNN